MHKVLVNRLGGLSLPGKSVIRLSDRPNITTAVYNNTTKTDRLEQTVQIQMRQLLMELTDKHLHCLPVHVHL